jgi:hypothetical protein
VIARKVHDRQDAFLSELERSLLAHGESADVAAPGLVQLSESLPRLSPPAALRERLMQSAHLENRLARFANRVAELLDVSAAKAALLLQGLDDPSVWSAELPGIEFCWVEGGPARAAAVRGFVRVQPGVDFPEHEHLGDEVVLVLQGGFEDRARQRVFRPGDVDRMAADSSHSFRALPHGPALLTLAVVETGLRALGHTYLPR